MIIQQQTLPLPSPAKPITQTSKNQNKMEGLQEISDILFCPLSSVEIEISNTKIRKDLLIQIISKVSNSKSVLTLQENLLSSLHSLESLDSFKSCEVKVLPGKSANSALIHYNLQDNKTWTCSAGADANNEGGRTYISGCFRNIREKADLTDLKIEYKPNTRTYGFELLHIDKLFRPGKWENYYSFKQGTEEIDTNFKQNAYSGSIGFRTLKNQLRSEFGRVVRTNKINTDLASLTLINEALPVTAKNFWLSEYKTSTIPSHRPTSGFSLQASNEFAYGKDNIFQKLDLKISKYFGLSNSIALQTSVNFGAFVPWQFSKVSLNDRYRIKYIKGFNSLGSRKLPADPVATCKYDVLGDDLGQESKLIVENKIHFYDAPVLEGTGLVPFVFGNLVCEAPGKVSSFRNYWREYVRGAVGVGIGFNLGVARLEVVYNSKVWKKKFDSEAGFQIVFGE